MLHFSLLYFVPPTKKRGFSVPSLCGAVNHVFLHLHSRGRSIKPGQILLPIHLLEGEHKKMEFQRQTYFVQRKQKLSSLVFFAHSFVNLGSAIFDFYYRGRRSFGRGFTVEHHQDRVATNKKF